MVNKNLFPSQTRDSNGGRSATTETLTKNLAGGQAYASTEKHAIAQIACTGCFNDTFYADATASLEKLKELVTVVASQPEGLRFLAKVALYSRTEGRMKDMPAFICATLALQKSPEATGLLKKIFLRCIDNGKQLRNFLQICRSHKVNVSRRSIKTMVRKWFEQKPASFIFNASIGNDPKMEDILKMCHVKPDTIQKEALFNYILGKPYNYNLLPSNVQALEFFKANKGLAEGQTADGVPLEVPEDIDFRLLDSFCSKEQMKKVWENQLLKGNWNMIRMNLNNFLKYGVFNKPSNVELASQVLGNKENVLRHKCFPYQIFNTYMNIDSAIPRAIKDALHDALEHSLHNVPTIEGKVYLCIDVSGSMGSAITGNRGSVTSTVRCVDVAALFACALLRNNKSADVIPFNTSIVRGFHVEPRDSVMTNTHKLASMLGGGTDCSSPLSHINQVHRDTEGVPVTIIMLSDNESWFGDSYYGGSRTRTQQEWNKFHAKHKNSRLVCIDLVPNTTHTVKSERSILKVGGFSDAVFTAIKNFSENSFEKDPWLAIIENMEV